MAAPASRDFDPGRISPGETIAGGAGVALFLFLFLHWFTGISAWSAFDVVDFVLAAIAIVAIAVAGARAMGNDIFGENTGMALTLLGTAASSMILTFVLEGDGRKIGLYLAFLAALALTYGGWRALHEAPGTPGPLAGMASRTSQAAPTTAMPASDPGVPGGGAAGVGEGKAGPGAPNPGTSTGGPDDKGGGPPPPAADPVPGQTGSQTPPGLAGEPPAGEGTHPPGL